jgi:hypothetical protein
LNKGDFGWSIFGLSLMDGTHSVTLTLKNDGTNQTLYWSDQWPTKGGWKQYTKAELDIEITNLTVKWWKKAKAKKKPKTRVTLWRIRQPTANLQQAP